jgi:hypothetical protein
MANEGAGMSDSRSLTYTLTMDDVIVWTQYHYAHSALCKRSFWIWRLVLCAIVFALVVAGTGLNAIGISGAVLSAGLYYFIFPGLRRRGVTRLVKKSYAEGKNKGLIGQHRLVIAEDGLESSSEVGEGKGIWAGIERIVEVPGYTFLYVGAFLAQVVPERGVTEGDYKAFMVELKRRWEAAQKEQPTPDSGS